VHLCLPYHSASSLCTACDHICIKYNAACFTMFRENSHAIGLDLICEGKIREFNSRYEEYYLDHLTNLVRDPHKLEDHVKLGNWMHPKINVAAAFYPHTRVNLEAELERDS
ncbi:hypothetical protein ACJX0J_005893, partial [Zea mays]